MAGRSRRFSSTSVDESDGRDGRVKYVPERAALKPVGKHVDPDDWPCYVLEDATIYLKDGKTIGNLLHAELQSSFVVRGRLVVDGDLRSRLVNKKMNGQYIEIADCQGFSIGSGPVTLWAMGQSGWLEIRPSEKYQKMYSIMAEAISIYYFVTELYEETKQMAKQMGKKPSKVNLSIDQILLKYAIQEGTGLVRSEAAEKIKSHAEFLLSQMRKGGSVTWKFTLFFKWLSAECHDIDTKLLEKSGKAVPPSIRIPLAALPTPIPQAPQPQPEPKPISKTLPHHSRPPILPPSRPTPAILPPSRSTQTIVLPAAPAASTPTPSNIPETGASTSTPTSTPSSLPETGAPLPTILTLMRTADADGSSPLARMTLSKLGTLFYYKYSIKSAPLSQEIIKLHAKAILSSLGPEWKIAPIHGQLTEASSKPASKNELKSQAMSVTEVKKRREASTIRKVPAGASAHGRRAVKREGDGDNTPEPHASKSLLPPYTGRRSGKEAGLRLANSPAVKRETLEGTSSDDDNSSRPSKRRRPSSPEMGDDDSDMDIASPPAILSIGDAETSAETSSSEESTIPLPPDPNLSFISIPLPSLSPTGPNGSWTCDQPSCSFVVRNAESSSGIEKIREHYNEHADRIEREALVMHEAKGRRLPVDHLLEKLRTLGESARLGGGGFKEENIGGREVPVAIKRERGMAV